MRRFFLADQCLLVDDHASFVPAVGSTVWIRYHEYRVTRVRHWLNPAPDRDVTVDLVAA